MFTLCVCVCFQSTTSGKDWGLWRFKVTKSCPWGPMPDSPWKDTPVLELIGCRGFSFCLELPRAGARAPPAEIPQALQFSSVAQSCPTLCDPKDCSTPGFSAHHQLPELAQTHAHQSSRWCHPTISSSVVPFSFCLQSFPASGSFSMSQFFASGGPSIGVSASTAVLPMNIQDWFPLGLTGLISLQSKGLSRVVSNTTVQKHQFFGSQLSLWSSSHIHTWLLETPWL